MADPRGLIPKPPLWLVPGVTALAFLTYAASLRHGIGFGDSGELVAAAIELGVPHPPGYPVWTVLSHAWTLLPGGDPAWKVALSSAVYMAFAVGGLAWLLWAAISMDASSEPSLARSALAAGGAFLFGFSTQAWSVAIDAEVYALHILFAVALWIAVIRFGRGGSDRGLALGAGVLFGLGLANHQTLLLAAPGYALCLALWQPRRLLRPSVLASIAIGIMLGLATYGLLPVWSQRNPVVDWSNTETWAGFWAHLSRQQYRSLGLERDWATVIAQWRFFASWLVREYLGFLLAALPFLAVSWQRQTRAGRAWFWGQVVAFAGSGVLFSYIANTELDNSNRAVLSVYFMLPGLSALLVAVPSLAWWLERDPQRHERQAPYVGGGMLALAFAQALVVGPRISRAGSTVGDDFIAHMTTDLPPHAVVIAGTGVVQFGLLYAKVSGQRPDIAALSFNRLANVSYQDEARNQGAHLTWPTTEDYRAAFNAIAPGADAVYGAQGITVANGYVLGKLLRLNPGHDFWYDEGIPVEWIYGNARPYGMLLHLSRKAVDRVEASVAQHDREFWDALSEQLLRRPDFRRDPEARRAFSRRRSTIGAWYAWHGDWTDAEYALLQALRLSPDNVDAAAKLSMVYAGQGRVEKGRAVLEAAIDRDPDNRSLRHLLAAYDAGEARWYGPR